MDLEHVLVSCKEIRQAYNALKQQKDLNCDSDLRHLLKQLMDFQVHLQILHHQQLPAHI